MKNEFKQKEEYKFESVFFCQRAGRVTQLVRNFRGITEYFRFKIMSIYIWFYTVCFCGNRCTNIDIHAYFDFCLVNLLLLLTWILIKKLYCISQKMSKTIFKYFEYFFFIMSQSHIDKWIVYFIVRIRLAIFSATITCNEVN